MSEYDDWVIGLAVDQHEAAIHHAMMRKRWERLRATDAELLNELFLDKQWDRIRAVLAPYDVPFDRGD